MSEGTSMKDRLASFKQSFMDLFGEDGPDTITFDSMPLANGETATYVSASREMIVKSEGEERLVTGIVLEPETVDSHGDIYSSDEIFKAQESFMTACRKMKLQHAVNSDSYVVESWTTKNDETIGGQDVKKGTWLMTVRLPEDEWELVKKGDFTGFSIGCKAVGTTIVKSEDQPKRRLTDFDFSHDGAEVSLVDKAANRRVILTMKSKELAQPNLVDVEKNIDQLIGLLSSVMGPQNDVQAVHHDETEEKELSPEQGMMESLMTNLRAAADSLQEYFSNSDIKTNSIEDPAVQYAEVPLFQIEKGEEDMNLEDVLKSEEGQEAIQALIEKAVNEKAEEVAKAQEENEKLNAAIAVLEKAEEGRVNAEFVATAESYSDLGMNAEDINLLKAVAETGSENYDRLIEVLNVAKSAATNQEILEVQGEDGEEEVENTDLSESLPKEVLAKAEELRKEDATLSQPQAIAKALRS